MTIPYPIGVRIVENKAPRVYAPGDFEYLVRHAGDPGHMEGRCRGCGDAVTDATPWVIEMPPPRVFEFDTLEPPLPRLDVRRPYLWHRACAPADLVRDWDAKLERATNGTDLLGRLIA